MSAESYRDRSGEREAIKALEAIAVAIDSNTDMLARIARAIESGVEAFEGK